MVGPIRLPSGITEPTRHSLLRSSLPPLVVILGPALVYAVTLAPDLSWANQGADGGDFITAAATGGVAHPPGYPTYLLLAWLFQQLPLGTLAFRTNLLSAACAVAASVVLSAVVARSLRATAAARGVRAAAGLLAGFAFGLSPLLWSQAVITEVHALHALFVALLFWFMLPGREGRWRDRLGGLTFGLALGNHLTVALLLPPWLLLGAGAAEQGGRGAGEKSPRLQWRSLLRRTGWLALGLLVYATLPLRARSGSPTVWGDPTTREGFWWLVSGQLYRDLLFTIPRAALGARIQEWATSFGVQFGALLVLALLPARLVGRRMRWVSLWTVLVFAAFALGYRTDDAGAYLVPAFLALALRLGWGAAALLNALRRRSAPRGPGHGTGWLTPTVASVLVLLVFSNAVPRLRAIDASRDARARAFAQAVLAGAPADAILVSNEDEGVFTLWYHHFALGERPDVVVVSASLLRFDWYRASLRRAYPQLITPAETRTGFWYLDLAAANAERPICMTHVDSERALVCPAPGA